MFNTSLKRERMQAQLARLRKKEIQVAQERSILKTKQDVVSQIQEM